jgi:hypothetical protein
MIQSLVPLGAALIALLFAVQLARQFMQRRRPHQLWWSVSMLSYACASFGEFYALAVGWNVPMYILYYFNAVSLVAIMSAGQIYMLFSKKIGHVYLGAMIALMAVFAIMLAGAAPDPAALAANDAAIGGDALPKGSLIRSLFPPVLSGIGGLILIFGPLWSWWKTRHSTSLFIAGGALLLSAAGRLAVLGYPQWLPAAELIGIAIIFFGVVRGTEGKKRTVTTLNG